MAENRLIISSSLILGAVLLDLLIGDPKILPHPVQAMGALITFLRQSLELYIPKRITYLRVGGFLITFLVVCSSGLIGWLIEQLFLSKHSLIPLHLSYLVLIISLASCLASKSLIRGVLEIIEAIERYSNKKNIEVARIKLANIVGRDVDDLEEDEILRATAESASENAVDGIFAPLFWMMIGVFFWKLSPVLPGPLTMAWIFKSTSTIDSMLGYKKGNLRWIGESGARLDDILTFIPCRIVVFSLPLISNNWIKAPSLIKLAWGEGSNDVSPNSGLSEAIFAHCVQVRMGGVNKYKNKFLAKPILAANAPKANVARIKKILSLSVKLEIIWVLVFILILNFTG